MTDCLSCWALPWLLGCLSTPPVDSLGRARGTLSPPNGVYDVQLANTALFFCALITRATWQTLGTHSSRRHDCPLSTLPLPYTGTINRLNRGLISYTKARNDHGEAGRETHAARSHIHATWARHAGTEGGHSSIFFTCSRRPGQAHQRVRQECLCSWIIISGT